MFALAVEENCRRLAQLVEEALIAEVTLSPKPGLVDAIDSGAHHDMDQALFLRSARALTPYFEEMALVSWGSSMSQELREAIAAIGRKAEQAMLAATGGINTHKGAIWALGLLISAVSSQLSRKQRIFLPEVFSDIQLLTAFPDRALIQQTESHGKTVQAKYGHLGAYGEAAAGFPHVQIALADYFSRDCSNETKKRLHMLLAIIATLDDTCILYRSNQEVLALVQQLAQKANQQALPNPAFHALAAFCQSENVSPGGSADLLAASFFLLSINSALPVNEGKTVYQ
ncbi:triphosphoribosyl-dephospho-CoA synthase [Enterococcus sp. 3G6_DIV0642]|uniref:triphosphoribosyl-dephospho-CoA synthase n=1 Tax=Enterococcus sp. 3G6_DIV0642 TaxID=1834177 RepID=UPI000A348510|nr:triphosphoribosyl-dephospho-CoA synthase [Enterococcus sp. 3G6_DIV0642]OTO17048.1 hypothetical protein A5878_001624 [Enterococcus sp. 3G6_DIV0642]